MKNQLVRAENLYSILQKYKILFFLYFCNHLSNSLTHFRQSRNYKENDCIDGVNLIDIIKCNGGSKMDHKTKQLALIIKR